VTTAPAPPPSGIGNPLAQAGSASTGPFGLPDLSAHGINLLLGQNPAPAAPGGPAGAAVPSLNPFDPGYLVALNTAPAAPSEGTPATGIGPNSEDPGTGRIAFLRRLHEMYQDGALTGALLGQTALDEFGGPIPIPLPETPLPETLLPETPLPETLLPETPPAETPLAETPPPPG
jgi:hypothetical protein